MTGRDLYPPDKRRRSLVVRLLKRVRKLSGLGRRMESGKAKQGRLNILYRSRSRLNSSGMATSMRDWADSTLCMIS